MTSRLLPLLLPLALFGCSWFASPPNEDRQLALACEVTRCECRAVHSSLSFSREKPPAPIEWHPDGSAACPAGYTLGRTE